MLCCCNLKKKNPKPRQKKKGGELKTRKKKRNLVFQCGICTLKNCRIRDIPLHFLLWLLHSSEIKHLIFK